MLRCLMGSIIWFLLHLWVSAKAPKSTKRTFAVAWPQVALLIFCGLIFSFDLGCWHYAVRYSGAGVATILANTQVLYLALAGFLFLHEPISFLLWKAVATSFVGIILLVGTAGSHTLGEHYWIGIGLGCITGVLYASYTFTLRRAEQGLLGWSLQLKMAVISLSSGIGLGGIALFNHEPIFEVSLNDFYWTFALALVVQVCGWWLIVANLRRVRIATAGLLMLGQPVFACFLSYQLLGEEYSILQLLGAAIALIGIYIGSLTRLTPLQKIGAK